MTQSDFFILKGPSCRIDGQEEESKSRYGQGDGEAPEVFQTEDDGSKDDSGQKGEVEMVR